VAPTPASSGKLVRHWLDRGGDRRLHRALHAAVLCLRSACARSQGGSDRTRVWHAEGRFRAAFGTGPIPLPIVFAAVLGLAGGTYRGPAARGRTATA
jgi:hypothetical protein